MGGRSGETYGTAPSLPERIGSYSVEGRLGRGGMGEVYLGFDPKLRRRVAIKAVSRDVADDPDRQRRLRREAEILASFNHPNIALIYGLEIEESGAAYLIMEYVPGRTLRDVLREDGLTYERALELCTVIARTMEMVHNRGIIHRDLKPANVHITPDGQVKVLDFGLAVASGAPSPGPSDATTATHEPSALSHIVQGGTPGYMSPEQVREQPVDQRTDVFSFGCVLYECLTGRRAFHGSSRSDLARAVLEDEPEWDALPRKLPEGTAAALRRCLERDLSRRAQRLGEVRAALDDAIVALRAPAAPVLREPNPTNLPTLLTPLVGRHDDIGAIALLFLESRLVTLTGAGGCGKTRLAIRAGECALPERPGGVWLVELAGVSNPEALEASVGAALGVEPGEAVAKLRSLLVRGMALMVLDNCEHLIAPCRALADRLLRACPGLHVLATSQSPLGVAGEAVFIVPSLDVPGSDEPDDAGEVGQYDSVKLFVQRARLSNPRFQLTNQNARAVANICRRLDGVPLAIELAAARARLLTPAQIEEHLHDMFKLLTGGTDAALERHRTLRAAMDWSFGLLADDEKEMIRALSVFAGGWTLAGAIAVCSEHPDEYRTIDLLDRLVSKSLVTREEHDGAPRFRLLEPIRQHARRCAGRVHHADFSYRHCNYFARLLDDAQARFSVSDDLAVLSTLRREKDNFLEAQRYAFQTGMRTALDLTGSLRRVWPLLVPGWKPERREGARPAPDQ